MTTSTLLSREKFKDLVFARENGKCAFCDSPAVDAHHILERRLFPDGGYYLANGAALCAEHHMMCETTEISVEQVRQACGIRETLLPPHLDTDSLYDKWGNQILANGMRMRGELFHDEGVQKALKVGNMLEYFSRRYKYPRTPHLPFSASVANDDKVVGDVSSFEGKRVIVTIKMDGENTTLYNDYTHARSIDGRSHPSRDWLKMFWSTISHDIPEDWRICGENVYARHSIAYENLETYFYGFSIWDNCNVCLGWDETLEWFELIGIMPVHVLYDGVFDISALKVLAANMDTTKNEGFVVRLADQVPYGDFQKSFAKWVRPDHVTTSSHWMNSEIVPNSLRC